MRIARYSFDDVARFGVVDGDSVTEVVGLDDGSPDALVRGLADGRFRRGAARALADVRLLAPVPAPTKIVAVGLNYVDHAAESGNTMPKEPLLFAKFPNAIVGPEEPIRWDRALTDQVDFEAELAVVVGRRAREVSEADALSYVLGYTCLNDVSARDLQFRDGQWVRGKSLDSFCPVGPWIVTPDEVGDPQKLSISCTVSGELLQSATTADMFFGVAELVSWISRNFTLEPGDLVATGSPPGVGYFRDPKRLLRDGDLVTVAVERVGELRNPCRATGRPRRDVGGSERT